MSHQLPARLLVLAFSQKTTPKEGVGRVTKAIDIRIVEVKMEVKRVFVISNGIKIRLVHTRARKLCARVQIKLFVIFILEQTSTTISR